MSLKKRIFLGAQLIHTHKKTSIKAKGRHGTIENADKTVEDAQERSETAMKRLGMGKNGERSGTPRNLRVVTE